MVLIRFGHRTRRVLTVYPLGAAPGDAALASDSERGFEKLMDADAEARGKRYVMEKTTGRSA